MKKSILSIVSFTVLLAGFYPAYVFLLGQFVFVEEEEIKVQIKENKMSRAESPAQSN